MVSMALLMASGAAGQTADDGEFGEPDTSVVVVFEAPGDRSAAPIEDRGGHVTGGANVDIAPVLFANVNENAIPSLERAPGVRYVSRDLDVEAISQSVDWGVERVGGPSAAAQVDETGVAVGVIDTGIDYRHEDLEGSVTWGVNTVGDTTTEGMEAAYDGHGHGTHVAGVVGADDNDVGVVGVAPDAELYSLKALDDDGVGSTSDVIEAVDYALKGPDGSLGDGASVVTMSFGAEQGTRALEDSLDQASKYAVLVAAAGNSGDGDATTDNVMYPAAYSSVIAVAATDRDDETPSWSSEGSAVELAAPGVDIRSTLPDDRYGSRQGTSMAAPHVSGSAALVQAADPALTPREVRWILQETAYDIEEEGIDKLSGYGLVQAHTAVAATNPPEVEILHPEDGANVSGEIEVRVNAWKDGEPDGSLVVEVAAGDSGYEEASFDDDEGVYVLSWDTVEADEGLNTVTARAEDSSGNVVTDSVTVTVDNENTPPYVEFNSPLDGDTVSGDVYVRVAASDDRTPVEDLDVELRFDDGDWREMEYDAEFGSFETDWNSSETGLGETTLEARAIDEEELESTTSISVEVVNETVVEADERMNWVAEMVHAELDGEMEMRRFGVRVARAQTADARADVVAAELTRVEERLQELSGIPRAEMTPRQVADEATLRGLDQRARGAAATLPVAVRERKGIDEARLGEPPEFVGERPVDGARIGAGRTVSDPGRDVTPKPPYRTARPEPPERERPEDVDEPDDGSEEQPRPENDRPAGAPSVDGLPDGAPSPGVDRSPSNPGDSGPPSGSDRGVGGSGGGGSNVGGGAGAVRGTHGWVSYVGGVLR